MQVDRLPSSLFSEVDAERLAAELYGLQGRARRLPGEYDENFHLRTAGGEERVLKVMRRDCPGELVEMQCRALEHLAAHSPARAPELALPRVCPAAGGEAVTTVVAPDGSRRRVWMLTWVPGGTLAEANPRPPELLHSLGRLLGEMDRALAGFDHPGAHRELQWDLTRATWVRQALDCVEGSERRALVERFLTLYEAQVEPALPELRRSVIHGDANDHNVLVNGPRERPRRAVSVVDFGDMHSAPVVCEPAVAAAYALFGQADPLATVARVVAGYHQAYPLEEREIALLFPLVAARLVVSVVSSAYRKRLRPEETYLTVSEAPAWAALERLAGVHSRFAHYTLRQACGLEPVPGSEGVAAWLRSAQREMAPVLGEELAGLPYRLFDLSVGSPLLGADPRAVEGETLTRTLFRELEAAGAPVGVGRYGEARLLEPRLLESARRTGPQSAPQIAPGDQPPTLHLGVDLFVAPGSPVHAPLPGTVHALAGEDGAGLPTAALLLRHETGDGAPFFTLYRHLSPASVAGLTPGQGVVAGQPLGRVASPAENGGRPPHLHLQLLTDPLERGADFPGLVPCRERPVWQSLAPAPGPLLGLGPERLPPAGPEREETVALRRAHLGPNLSLSYRQPLEIVRGWMQHLYDETGRAYLDFYNNVPIVGHSHPRVVKAVAEQMALLNTNTRYLHPLIARYARRLAGLLPEPLAVCYFLNSASEANELALRLARAHTGRRELIVLESAYHGHTTSLIEASPYKFDGPGGEGAPPWVHVAPLPDDYRGPFRRGDPEAGRQEAGPEYAREVAERVAEMAARGCPPGAFMAESLPSVGGQIVFPPGYLAPVYRSVRAAGGVCIADEVQVAFGRLGSHFWGFETQGVVPDVVVLGKPMGNGHPLAAVVTTREIAASFDTGMEFFSTFGGNPVACAAGLAVLDVLEEEGLPERARRLGEHLLAGLRELGERHPVVGDVRGMGLFLGVELVRDRESLEPAGEEASQVVNRLREEGILAGTDGPHHNVLKLRPPLVITPEDADRFVTTLDAVLGEDGVQV